VSYTPGAAWLEAFERSPVEPVISVEIERPYNTRIAFHTGDRDYELGPDSVPYLDTVTPVERSIGVYDRKISLGVFELELVDAGGDDGAFAVQAGEVVSRLAGTLTKGARVILSVGEADLDAADYEPIHEGMLIDDVRKVPGGVQITVIDPFSFGLDEERATYWRPGHPLAVIRSQLLAALPPAMLTDSSLLEINNPDTAHLVVSRWPYFLSGDSATGAVGGAVLNNWTFYIPLRINERKPGIDQISELLFLLRGSLSDGRYRSNGAISFLPLDLGKAVTRHFTSDEVFGLEQISGPMDVINRFEVLGHSYPTDTQAAATTGGEKTTLYRGVHASSPTDLAYPSASPTPKFYDPAEPFFSSWLNAFQELEAQQLIGFDAAATSLAIRLPLFYGFTGTALYDASGNWDPPPNSTIRSEHAISGTKPAYLLITDHAGTSEIIRAEAFAYDTVRGQLEIGDQFWRWGTYSSITRGQRGTVAVDWEDVFDLGSGSPTRIYVYDITLAVFVAESVVDRHAYGVPGIRFWAPLHAYGLDLGDFISLDSPDFMFATGNDTHQDLDANIIFEVTRVAEHWRGEMPAIAIEAHFVRDTAYTPGVLDEDPFAGDIPIGSFPPGEVYYDADGETYVDDLGGAYTDY